jgi:hypothetical protein
MTITGTNLITDALRTIAVVASAESPSSQELADGLVSLNKLIDSLGGEGVDLIQLTVVSVSTGGRGPFTTARPSKIKAAVSAASGFAGPVKICSAEEYAQINDAGTTSSLCTHLFCDYAYPTSNIYIWPSTSAALTLYNYMPLTQFSSLSTSIDLPQGHARMLTLLLAVDLCEQFEKPLTESLMQSAMAAKTALGGWNMRDLGDAPAPATAPAG